MRTFALMGCLVMASVAGAQRGTAGSSVSSSTVSAELGQALVGDWVGVLEYRDYSEPAASTKRVQLPTWLAIAPSGSGLGLQFVYDDGPTKTVVEDDVWTFDPVAGSFSEADNGKSAQVYAVTGFAGLKSGRGELVMTGRTVDNDKPAESRITLTVRRNLVAWTEEVRPVGSSEGFAFRHRYVFTRAAVPR
jgi:hypothetical protein